MIVSKANYSSSFLELDNWFLCWWNSILIPEMHYGAELKIFRYTFFIVERNHDAFGISVRKSLFHLKASLYSCSICFMIDIIYISDSMTQTMFFTLINWKIFLIHITYIILYVSRSWRCVIQGDLSCQVAWQLWSWVCFCILSLPWFDCKSELFLWTIGL